MAKDALYKNLPDTPGVYLMRDAKGALLYVGKAANLKRRVSSYFLRPHDTRIERLVSKIAKIDFEKAGSAIEALIREAELIKEHEPPFNIREKDDKSFLYVEITKEPFPRIILARGKDIAKENYKVRDRFGPFTSAHSLKDAMKIIRRIFPWNSHTADEVGICARACFNYEIGLCPGTCIGAITRPEYLKTVRNISLFFEGKKERVVKILSKDMAAAAKKMDFEKAEVIKRQIFALKHIQDIAFISEDKIAGESDNQKLRIEGYDISNISGVSAVGSMVVFVDGEPDKNEYRKFKIKTVTGPNDFAMLQEVLSRRFARSVEPPAGEPNWPLPDVILIDGGKGQVSAAKAILDGYNLKIPIVGLAKGPERKRNDLIGLIPKGLAVDTKTLIKVRDEAHRFAISYHKNLRGRNFFE
jgi:excinuclease ABC subunit C